MANRESFKEAIQLYVETSGDKEIGRLAEVLTKLGQGADASAEQAQALVDELDRLAGISNNIRNFTEMKAAIASTGEALEKAQAEAAELRREFDQAENPTRRLQRAMERAEGSVERLTKQQNRQQAEFGRSSMALRAAGVDTENLADAYAELQGRMGSLGERAADAAEAMDRTGTGTKKAAAGMTLMGRASEGASKSLSKIGARLTAVSAAATAAVAAMAAAGTAALFTGAIRSASTLEDALSQVRAVSGATAEDMVALKRAAEAGGAATRFSTLEAAQGLGELARATGNVTSAIAALPATLNLAQAAGIGVSEAALLMTTTLTQFGLNADQAGRVADVMAKEVNSTTDSMEGLGNALTYSAPLAKQLGLDLEETAAILGVLADQGFRGERAGTALRNVFTELSDPASDFASGLREIGIESTDFATVIEQLAAKGQRGRDALLNLDAAARPAITALVDSGSAKLAQLEASLRAASGEAERTAKIMGDNVSGALEKITDTYDRTRRKLVDPLLAPLQDELEALSKELEDFAKSPEFEEIAGALKTLFVESAEAARKLLQEVDFTALAKSIRDFATDADGSLTQFKNGLGEVVDAVQIIGDTVSLVFNAVQTAVFAVAAVVAKGVALIAGHIDNLSEPARRVLEFIGVLDKAPSALERFAGGMDAVSDEFAKRMIENGAEFIQAARDWGDGVGEAGDDAAKGMDRAATASEELAAASKQVAAGATEAKEALSGQAQGATVAAQTTSAAAEQMAGDAERLKKAFADMGLQSQADLNATAESAKRNFELINSAVAKGGATAEDAKRAYEVYAGAQKAAVADSGAAAQAQVEHQLKIQRAMLGPIGTAKELGEANREAGKKTEQAAGGASTALIEMGDAAGTAADGTEAAASATEAAAGNMEYGSKAGQQFALSMYEVSEAAMQAYGATNRLAGSPLWSRAINDVTAKINEQGEALNRQVEALEQANAQYDEMAQKRQQLSQQFDLLGAGEIEKLVQAQAKLEANRKRAAAERERERAAQVRQAEADAQVKVAQREATDAAVAVNDMLGRTKEAADALQVAAGTVRSASEVVIRVVNDTNGEPRLKFSDRDLNFIASEVFRRLELSKRASR